MSISIQEFSSKLSEIMPVIIKEFTKKLTGQLRESNITVPQFLILDFLFREGESKMTELANFMNVSTAAMTGLIDRLAKENCVERIFDPQDRRIIKIKLSTHGDILIRNITERKLQMITKVFGKITGPDREQYIRILGQVKNILVEENR